MRKVLLKKMESPFGTLLLGSFDNKLCLCDWYNSGNYAQDCAIFSKYLSSEAVFADSSITENAAFQLTRFINGRSFDFDIPLLFCGTEFQKKVWAEIKEVSFSNTLSYKDLAINVGHQTAVRAVANAAARNIISLFVPCHRIVASNGKIGGYRGGVVTKIALLKLENKKNIYLPVNLKLDR